MVKNQMVTFEEFKNDMSWNTLDFTEAQLQAIYNSVVTGEYAAISDVVENEEVNESYDTCFFDVSLSAVVDYLADLNDAAIIVQVLTVPYGYQMTEGTIYHLEEDGGYCLVMKG